MRAKLETLLSPHLLCDRLHENYADVAVVVPDPAIKNQGVGPGMPSTDRFEAGGLGWDFIFFVSSLKGMTVSINLLNRVNRATEHLSNLYK